MIKAGQISLSRTLKRSFIVLFFCGTATGSDQCLTAHNPQHCKQLKTAATASTATISALSLAGTAYSLKRNSDAKAGKLSPLFSTRGQTDFANLQRQAKAIDNNFLASIAKQTPTGAEVTIRYYPSPEAYKQAELLRISQQVSQLKSKIKKSNRLIDSLRSRARRSLPKEMKQHRDLLTEMARLIKEYKQIENSDLKDLKPRMATRTFKADPNASNITRFLTSRGRKGMGVYEITRKPMPGESAKKARAWGRRGLLSMAVGLLGSSAALTESFTSQGSRMASDRLTNPPSEWALESFSENSAN